MFTKESLRNLQDKMRENCIKVYNKEYGLDDILNETNNSKDYHAIEKDDFER